MTCVENEILKICVIHILVKARRKHRYIPQIYAKNSISFIHRLLVLFQHFIPESISFW